RAPSGLWPSGPASAAPAAASSSDPSLGDLLDPRHATVEPAHDLADEGVVLRAGGTLAGRLVRVGRRLPQAKLNGHLVTEPRAHEWQQLRRLVLRLLVMEPVAEPQDQDRPIDFRLCVQISSAHGPTQLIQHACPSRNIPLPTPWGGGLRPPGAYRWGCWFWNGWWGYWLLLSNANLNRQPGQRRLDQEPRLSMSPHLPIEMQQRVEHRGQAASRRRIVASERRHQSVPAPLHQTPHHLPQLRARRVNAVQLFQRLRRAPLEHVIQKRIEQARVRDPQKRPRALQRDRPRSQGNQLVEQTHR